MTCPTTQSATAVSLLINASGAVSLNLTPLMTPEDVDAAAAEDALISRSRDLTTAVDRAPSFAVANHRRLWGAAA